MGGAESGVHETGDGQRARKCKQFPEAAKMVARMKGDADHGDASSGNGAKFQAGAVSNGRCEHASS